MVSHMSVVSLGAHFFCHLGCNLGFLTHLNERAQWSMRLPAGIERFSQARFEARVLPHTRGT